MVPDVLDSRLADLHLNTISLDDYRDLHQSLATFAIRYVENSEAAGDMASDCLINCWEEGRRKPVAFLYRHLIQWITQHAGDWQYRNQNRKGAEEHAAARQTLGGRDDAPLIAEYQNELTRLIGHLEPDLRDIAKMNLVCEISLYDISVEIGKSYSTVKYARDLAIYHIKRLLYVK